MHANAYHYLQTFTVVQDDLTNGRFVPAVLDRLRSSARRRFLEQLGAYADNLAQRHLSLRIRDITQSKSLGLGPGDIIAVTQLLERVDEEMIIVESIYAVTNSWASLHQERIRVCIEDQTGQPRIPQPLHKSASKWVGLIRGITPSNERASWLNDQS